MRPISIVLRKIDAFFKHILNYSRITKLRLKYPSIEIIGNTVIEKNCKIICEDGGKLILKNTYISSGTMVRSTKNAIVQIFDSFIGQNCVIVSIEEIRIDSDCEIAEMVVIRDQDHIHDLTEKKIARQGFSSSPIVIGKNVWIGCKATVLQGVTIGSNSVVGAHSLVKNSFPPSSIVLGTPAKRINTNG